MKNLLFSICMLIAMTSYSQISKELPGIWKGKSSSHYVFVVVNEEEKLQFTNVSWEEGNILKEEVLEKEKEHIITQIYNPENDWWVSIKYTMIDENYGSFNLEKDHGLRLEEYDSEISNVKNNSKTL